LGLLPLVARANPILIENQREGSTSWDLQKPGNDASRQVKGYASATSVAAGETIAMHVAVAVTQKVDLELYRVGWYGGTGGRLVHWERNVQCAARPTVRIDPVTGCVRCDWPALVKWTVPADWPSGVYLVRLVNAAGFDNHICFVVRDDLRTVDLLYQQPVTTYQAYNNFPADRRSGKSLYGTNSFGPRTQTGHTFGTVVSFDRPYPRGGTGQLTRWEISMIRWLEMEGFDVGYCTSLDLHARPELLERARAMLSVGHDEYWTSEMFSNAEAARDAGVGLGFFCGNSVYWQTRLLPAADGRLDRDMACYRVATLDPEPDPAKKTCLFRDVGRPQQPLLGVQYDGFVDKGYTGLVVAEPEHWMFAGTGFQRGDRIEGVLGPEVDAFDATLPAPLGDQRALPFASPFTRQKDKAGSTSHASVYRAPSGAWVFAAGTIGWAQALGVPKLVDPRLQRTTRNVLERLIGR
jgi:hypothetical protein